VGPGPAGAGSGRDTTVYTQCTHTTVRRPSAAVRRWESHAHSQHSSDTPWAVPRVGNLDRERTDTALKLHRQVGNLDRNMTHTAQQGGALARGSSGAWREHTESIELHTAPKRRRSSVLRCRSSARGVNRVKTEGHTAGHSSDTHKLGTVLAKTRNTSCNVTGCAMGM